MTTFDDSLVPGVASILSSLGRSSTWAIEAANVYDPSTQQVIAHEVADVVVKCSPPVLERRSADDGREVQEATIVIAAEGLTFTPRPGLKVTIDGEALRVTSAKAIYSGDDVCAWEALLE